MCVCVCVCVCSCVYNYFLIKHVVAVSLLQVQGKIPRDSSKANCFQLANTDNIMLTVISFH